MTIELPKIPAYVERNILFAAKLSSARFGDAKNFPSLTGFFAHHDPEEPTLIRHLKPNTEGSLKGTILTFTSRNFTTQKPGKFLKQYFSAVLSDAAIAKHAAIFRAHGTPPELEFALTPEQIEHVYLTGPSSCMKAPRDNWGATQHAPYHPTAIFSSPDLGVAYIKRADAITARCVVNRTRKVHSKIYGDQTAMQLALSKHDFKPGTTNSLFIGALFGAFAVPNLKSSLSTPVYLSSFNDHENFYLREEFTADGQLYLRGIKLSDLKPAEPHHTLMRTYTLAGSGSTGKPTYNSHADYLKAEAAAKAKAKLAEASAQKKTLPKAKRITPTRPRITTARQRGRVA